MKKRRSFLKSLALTGLFGSLSGFSSARNHPEDILEELLTPKPSSGKSVMGLTVDPIPQVRVGVVGLGNRGSFLTKLVDALCPDKATLVAVCDVRKERVDETLKNLKDSGHGQKPDVYHSDPEAWKSMMQRDDIDLVLVVTPWDLHVPMCVYGMRQGKHVATEVPAAYTLEGCWDLVNTAEETQRNCMMLENVCYGDEELWLLNMVTEGVLGTLTYGEAAYIHDLKGSLFGNNYYNSWRMRHHVAHDGNLYPTHGLGPVAQYMGIDRGDRFETLTSMSTKQASLQEHSQTVDRNNEFYNRTDFAHGDMNNSLIKTANGRMILVQHDVVTPRPYSRINLISGTKGTHEGYPSRLALASHKHGHEWMDEKTYQDYREKYKHPIWAKLKKEIEKNGGHGGMDFVEIYRLVDCLNQGRPLDMDVYDAASWSVVTPLSELSIQLGNIPVKFPDFTRGKWKENRTLGMLKYV